MGALWRNNNNNFEIYKSTKVLTFAFPGLFRSSKTHGNFLCSSMIRHIDHIVSFDPIPMSGGIAGFDLTSDVTNYYNDKFRPIHFKPSCAPTHRPSYYAELVQAICVIPDLQPDYAQHFAHLNSFVVSKDDWDKNYSQFKETREGYCATCCIAYMDRYECVQCCCLSTCCCCCEHHPCTYSCCFPVRFRCFSPSGGSHQGRWVFR